MVNINTAIMLVVLVVLGVLSWFTHGIDGVVDGLKSSLNTLNNVWAILLLALGVAGFIQVIIPQEIVSQYLGPASGFKGYLIAWGVGAVTPGAPFAVYPIAVSLLSAGSGVGQIMTLVLSASIGVAATRIPYEIAFFGWRFSVLRLLSVFFFPIVGGLFAGYFSRFIQIS